MQLERETRPPCQIYRGAELDPERPSRRSSKLSRRDLCLQHYQDQLLEHETAIWHLQRRIAKPDNEAVKAFAIKLIPALKTELVTVKTALEIKIWVICIRCFSELRPTVPRYRSEARAASFVHLSRWKLSDTWPPAGGCIRLLQIAHVRRN